MKTWQKIKQQPDLLEQYLFREQVVDTIRQFFKSQSFHEVETPLLVEQPSTETYLEFFETELELASGLKERGFLITSPEYAMKKLLAAGMTHIFQLTKSFRNSEGLSSRHNPEFLILEWYRANADYTDIMADCEALLCDLVEKTKGLIQGKAIITYQGQEYDLTPPWPRISVPEAFAQFAHVSLDELLDEQQLLKKATAKGYQVTAETTWEEVYNQIFLNEIDPKLSEFTTPVILYDYPASQAALSRRKISDPRLAERFEFYLAGIELGNAFSELIDPQEQEKRLRSDLQFRKEIGKKTYDLDEDFIDALKEGLPPTGGVAVGVDRLIMLLADVPSIHDTMFFPVHDVFAVEQ